MPGSQPQDSAPLLNSPIEGVDRWGRSAGFYKCANNLTLDACHPVSKEPELKAAAVRVKKLEGLQID